MVCDDNLMLSKLLYLHVIYYNVIGQDPSHDTYFNLTNILKKKWQKVFLTTFFLILFLLSNITIKK